LDGRNRAFRRLKSLAALVEAFPNLTYLKLVLGDSGPWEWIKLQDAAMTLSGLVSLKDLVVIGNILGGCHKSFNFLICRPRQLRCTFVDEGYDDYEGTKYALSDLKISLISGGHLKSIKLSGFKVQLKPYLLNSGNVLLKRSLNFRWT